MEKSLPFRQTFALSLSAEIRDGPRVALHICAVLGDQLLQFLDLALPRLLALAPACAQPLSPRLLELSGHLLSLRCPRRFVGFLPLSAQKCNFIVLAHRFYFQRLELDRRVSERLGRLVGSFLL